MTSKVIVRKLQGETPFVKTQSGTIYKLQTPHATKALGVNAAQLTEWCAVQCSWDKTGKGQPCFSGKVAKDKSFKDGEAISTTDVNIDESEARGTKYIKTMSGSFYILGAKKTGCRAFVPKTASAADLQQAGSQLSKPVLSEDGHSDEDLDLESVLSQAKSLETSADQNLEASMSSLV